MNYKENFLKALSKLNPQQRKAVETIYDPLMVIAGPGTGKTQLLSTRVGYILQQPDISPRNILCITYTNSGVEAMKKRIVELVGVEGHDVSVYTFHAFAYKVIEDYKKNHPVEDYTPLEDLEKKMLVREILTKIDFNTPLKQSMSNVESAIDFLLHFFETIKKEKLDVDKLMAEYELEKQTKREDERFIAKSKSKDGKYQKGDFRDDWFDDFVKVLDKHIQACSLYKDYQKIITEKKWVDFDDAILTAIDIIKNNEDIHADYQELYQFIMIDEFQDTNGSQLELINSILAGDSNPNIMVVGDEDQAIYRFQGANVYNIFNFHRQYLSHKTTEEQLNRVIVLEENYRSTPYILESSRSLIENNTERIKHIIEGKTINKILKTANQELKISKEPIWFYDVSQSDDKSVCIALEIEHLVQSGIQYKDIAVLFPKNSDALAFSRYLNFLNYPFELSRDENLLEDPLIKSYLNTFQFIIDFHSSPYIDSDVITSFLLHPWLGLTLEEISEFSVEHKVYINALSNSGTERQQFITYFENYQENEKIASIFAKIKRCILEYEIIPTERFFHLVLDSFKIKEWAVGRANRLEILQKIEALNRHLKDYIAEDSELRLSDYLNRLEDYKRENISIKYERHIRPENAVQLLSYHKSKGLEFDYVFVYGAGRYTVRNKTSIYLPQSIFDIDLNVDKEEKIKEEDKRRLLYVAMTRAKKKLYLVDDDRTQSDNKKEKSKNKYKTELNLVSQEDYQATSQIEAIAIKKNYTISEAEYIRFYSLSQTDLILKEEKLFENEFVENRIANYNLSHSSMTTYLECPQRFFYEKIISIPAETSSFMTSGNFYHHVLEEYFNQIKFAQANHSAKLLLDIAHKDIYKYRPFLTEYEFTDLQKSMDANFYIIFENYIAHTTNLDYLTEEHYQSVIDNNKINGKIDKIDFIENEVFITDFKTGKISNAKNKLKSYYDLEKIRENKMIEGKVLTIDERYGGNYWRQAMFYFLLMRDNIQDKKMSHFDFVFLIPEKDKIEKFTFYPNEKSIEYIENLISEVHSKIKKKEFSPCKSEDCSWCAKQSLRQSLDNE